MARSDHDGLRLNRRSALKALTLSAAALAAGAGVTDVIAAAAPAQAPLPKLGLAPRATLIGGGPTPPLPGITYQMFAGTDFHAEAGTPYTYNSTTGVAFASTTGDYFVTPINLPKGSQITECECYFVNEDTGTTFIFELHNTDPANNAVYITDHAQSSAIGPSLQVLRIAPIIGAGNNPADPSQTGFQLLAGNGGKAVLLGARIGYMAAAAAPEVNMLSLPIRLLETRPAYQDNTPGTGQTHPGRKLSNNETFDLPITGRVINGISVPAGARAVIGNVTVTGPVGGGFLTLFPQGGAKPSTSSINYGPGTTLANGVVVGLSPAGHISIYCYAQCDVIFDAAGYVL